MGSSALSFRHARWLLFIASIVLTSVGTGWAAGEPAPESWSHPQALPLDQVQRIRMPAVDVDRLIEEDRSKEDLRRIFARWSEEGGAVPEPLLRGLDAVSRQPLEDFLLQPGGQVPEALVAQLDKRRRVGRRMLVDLSPANSGTWSDLPGAGQVWRLRIESPGALWLVLGFDLFRLSPGARLHVYDPDRAHLLGPYTVRDVREHRRLWLPPLAGDSIVLELFWPGALRLDSPAAGGMKPELRLGTVSHGYVDIGLLPGQPAPTTPDSGACNIDVNCPLGNDWQNHKRGVVHLLLYGSSWCSASLINNTSEDCTPYVLTARHCIDTTSEAAGTSLRFNYERPGCASGVAPTNQIIAGTTLRSSYSNTDFTLLEMDQPPPEGHGVYFNGWSRAVAAAGNSTGIHHPSGDSKKISYNDDPLVDGQSSGWGSDHWRVTQWEQGTTEGGSSGSPLFDHDQRIVGQLHGGLASCSSITWDEYGKFDLSWTGGGSTSSRLSDWLDPLGLGVQTLDGVDHQTCLNPLPQLVLSDTFLADPSGNGNGFPEPGETVALQVSLRNTSSSTATQVSGTLSSLDPRVVVPRDLAAWPDMPPGSTESCSDPYFELQIAPDFPCGQSGLLQLQVSFDQSAEALPIEVPVTVGVPQIEEQFRDGFENGSTGWTHNGGWVQTTADSTSPTHSWFVKDVAAAKDYHLFMPTVQSVPQNARLVFQQRYDTQPGFDGGVLEFSVNGGQVWNDTAELFVANGYNGQIASGAGSALAGRAAWTADSGGWQQVELDLSQFAGTDLDLRWRFATDEATGGIGWFVDDVVLETRTFICEPAVPGEASDPDGGGGVFTIERPGGSYDLTWSAPAAGAPPTGYKLYRTPLGQPWLEPVCEADLGDSTATSLVSLADDCGFIVVPVNAAGEGSYGNDSEGNERPNATGVDICP